MRIPTPAKLFFLAVLALALLLPQASSAQGVSCLPTCAPDDGRFLVVTDDRSGTLAFFSQLFGAPVEDVAETPALLAGSVSEIVETLEARRERWGFNYVVVQHAPDQGMERFAEVISALAGT